jgi:hypothetical protein
MPSLKAGAIEDCLRRKLQAQELGGPHRRFEVFNDDGILVGRTALSRSWRSSTDVSPSMVSTIAKEMGLAKTSDWVSTVDCTKSRKEYLALAMS